MIHRDLKADNILILDKAELKICISDLGLACKTDNANEILAKCGTPGFVAPEVLKGQAFTTKTDVFSLGCLFFTMIMHRNLFSGKDGREILVANKYENPVHSVKLRVSGVSPECKKLLEWMVTPNPKLRPTAEECLGHPWFLNDQDAVQSSLYINKHQD